MAENKTVEHITIDDQTCAIIVRAHDFVPGINFVTPDSYSQQLAVMSHPAGKVIDPHVHNTVNRSVEITQEVLVIKSGTLQVDFYDETNTKRNETILKAGDIIVLAAGGHGFTALTDIEMIEIKQGPYVGDEDKTRFIPRDK